MFDRVLRTHTHIYIHTVDGWTDKERERSVIDRRDNLLLV